MSGVIVTEEKPQKITMITFLIMKSRDPGPTFRKSQQKTAENDKCEDPSKSKLNGFLVKLD